MNLFFRHEKLEHAFVNCIYKNKNRADIDNYWSKALLSDNYFQNLRETVLLMVDPFYNKP